MIQAHFAQRFELFTRAHADGSQSQQPGPAVISGSIQAGLNR